MLDDVVDLGADEPSDEGGKDHLVSPVRRLLQLGETLGKHDAGEDESKRKAQTEGLEGDGADVNLGLHGSPVDAKSNPRL